MKKKILIIFTLILSVLILTIFNIYVIPNTNAMSFSDLAHLGYDGVINKSLSTLQGYGSYDEGSWASCTQVLCIHSSNTANGTAMDPIMIIDINPDGDDPTGGTITTGSKTIPLENNATNATMAYLCYIAESADTHNSVTYANNYQLRSSYWWLYGYSNFIAGHKPGISFPTTGTYQGSKSWAQSDSIINDAIDYGNNYDDYDKTYSARIVVFDGGWSQSRIVVFGKESIPPPDDIPTVPEIDKYISSVTLPTGDVLNVGDRSGRTNSSKLADPVTVMPGSIVTYTIDIGGEAGTYNEGFYVDDTYDSYLSHYSGNTYRWSHVGDSYTVKLTVDDNTPSSNTKYENNAKIVGYGKDSSDYVKVVYEEEEETTTHETSGNYKKYIVKHNGQSVSGRSGYSNDTAKNNPVTVKKGDTVTFRLLVENTSNYDINDLLYLSIRFLLITFNN